MREAAVILHEDYIITDDDMSCTDDDFACIDDDYACVDADDAVCDDYRDGLLPHEAEAYEKEKAYLDLFIDVLRFPLRYGLSYEKINKYKSVVGYY